MRFASLAAALLFANAAFAADDIAVDVQNASTPTLCAEEDNVYVKLASPEVRRFKVEAVHPNYIGTIVVDRSAFDLHNCPELKAAPFITEQPRRITIYEDEKWQLIGITIPNFWRKTVVPVRVGDRSESGAQLLQLWTRANDRAEEVLVLYPQDGYWRARPLPPKNLSWSAYGSSFLVGPIEMKERPIVDIKEVVFDPATRTFRLQFTRGGSATLRLEKLDIDSQVLDVTLDPPVGGDLPFAALRSMFVTEINNDVAHLGWRVKGAKTLGAAASDGLQARERGRGLGRAARALAPQHQRAGHGVPGFCALIATQLLPQLPPRAAQRLEGEAHRGLARGHEDGAEDHVGAHDLAFDVR